MHSFGGGRFLQVFRRYLGRVFDRAMEEHLETPGMKSSDASPEPKSTKALSKLRRYPNGVYRGSRIL